MDAAPGVDRRRPRRGRRRSRASAARARRPRRARRRRRAPAQPRPCRSWARSRWVSRATSNAVGGVRGRRPSSPSGRPARSPRACVGVALEPVLVGDHHAHVPLPPASAGGPETWRTDSGALALRGLGGVPGLGDRRAARRGPRRAPARARRPGRRPRRRAARPRPGSARAGSTASRPSRSAASARRASALSLRVASAARFCAAVSASSSSAIDGLLLALSRSRIELGERGVLGGARRR